MQADLACAHSSSLVLTDGRCCAMPGDRSNASQHAQPRMPTTAKPNAVQQTSATITENAALLQAGPSSAGCVRRCSTVMRRARGRASCT